MPKRSANSLWPSDSSYVEPTGNVTWSGVHTHQKTPRLSSYSAPTQDTDFATKKYVDDNGGGGGGSSLLSSDNSWSGHNTFTDYLPTSSLTPSSNTHLATKLYVDSQAGVATSSNNTWTGTNAFNTSIPTSTVTPSADSDLTTKTYVDTLHAGRLTSNNAWTGTNTFNSSLPTSTVTPSANSDLTTKAYVDSVAGTAGGSLIPSNNTWTGTNAFNTSLPTSTVTPSANSDLTTKTYVDTLHAGRLTSNNAWTGTNTFNSSLPTSTVTPTAGSELVTKTYCDSIKSSTNTWTGATNTFTNNVVFGSVSNVTLSSGANCTFAGNCTFTGYSQWAPVNNFLTSYPSGTLYIFRNQATAQEIDYVATGNGATQGGHYFYTGLTSGTVNQLRMSVGPTQINLKPAVLMDSTLNVTGVATFTGVPVCSSAPSSGSDLTNKTYVDSVAASTLLGSNNTWTGTNAFNTSLPTSTVTPSGGSDLTTKTYVDTAIAAGGILGSNNTWTGTNAFNTSLPTSTVTPSGGTDLTTKTYVDSAVSAVTSNNNTWSGTNAFSTIPTCSVTPSSGFQIANKAYVDSATNSLLSGANAWTSTNTFNVSLPTSTVTPSSGTQLVTKTYADGLTTAMLSATNAWTGTNTFNTTLPSSSLTPSSGNQFVNKTYADTKAGITANNTFSGSNTFSAAFTVGTSTAQTIINARGSSWFRIDNTGNSFDSSTQAGFNIFRNRLGLHDSNLVACSSNTTNEGTFIFHTSHMSQNLNTTPNKRLMIASTAATFYVPIIMSGGGFQGDPSYTLTSSDIGYTSTVSPGSGSVSVGSQGDAIEMFNTTVPAGKWRCDYLIQINVTSSSGPMRFRCFSSTDGTGSSQPNSCICPTTWLPASMTGIVEVAGSNIHTLTASTSVYLFGQSILLNSTTADYVRANSFFRFTRIA